MIAGTAVFEALIRDWLEVDSGEKRAKVDGEIGREFTVRASMDPMLQPKGRQQRPGKRAGQRDPQDKNKSARPPKGRHR